MQFPYVHIQPYNNHAHASAGYALTAINPTRSIGDRTGALDFLRAAHSKHVRLAQLLSRVKAPRTLELHLVSSPSLDVALPGRIRIAVRLHALQSGRAGATESCLAQCLLLEGIMSTFWDHAEFRPILSGEEFERRFVPFAPEGCLCIHRRSREISLTHPFKEVKRSRLGFSPEGGSPKGADPASNVQHVFPWIPAHDDWSTLLDALLRYPMPQWVVVRVSSGTGANDGEVAIARLETTIRECERFLGTAPTDQLTLTGQTLAIRDVCLARISQLRETALRGAVLLFSPGPAEEAIAGIVGQSLSSDFTRGGTSNPYQGGFDVSAVDVDTAIDALCFYEDEPFTADEAACAFRLPLVLDDENHGLPVRKSRTMPAELPSPPLESQTTTLGVNNHRGDDRPIQVGLEHRLKHLFLIGMTGTGKSTMLLSLLRQDLLQGHGVCLIDPHGDLADDLLARFPEDREQDLILVDLADRRRPVPLNLLCWRTLDERDLIIDELFATLMRVYQDPQMFGPIFEMNFRGMMKLLMGDHHDEEFTPTLLEFPKLYQSEAFRRFLLERTQDAQVHDFVRELEKVRGENQLANLAPYITNKLARFLQDRHLRRMFGHGAMVLDFEALLNEGKVLLVKLARGLFGTTVADLLLSQLVVRIRWAAMSRAALPKDQRRAFFLYVDEFGTLGRDENFSLMLSESRKYGLGLVLATQYASQLRHAEKARDNLSAVLGNVGTVITYRVGAEDAPLLAPIFAPTIDSLDLLECPNFQGYMRLHLNQAAVRPFSFQNRCDDTPRDEERIERLSEASRRRWGVSAEECEQRAEARRRMIETLENAT